jgi:predicted nucleic acid-binding protein
MKQSTRLLTLDANVLIAALKSNEPYSEKCAEILSKVPNNFQLTEPSIIYQEVCGTLARKTTLEIANEARKQMELMINPKLLTNCDKNLCKSAFCLCSEYNIYSIDALYLQVALKNNAILVSLDKEDFIDKIKKKKASIEVYNVPEFPY